MHCRCAVLTLTHAVVAPPAWRAGRTRIQLKPTGELFSLVPPTSKANNVIIGAPRCAVLCMLCCACRATLTAALCGAAVGACITRLQPAMLLRLQLLQVQLQGNCIRACQSAMQHSAAEPPTSPKHILAPLPAGKTWIDTYGDMTLLNSTTGAKAYLYFTPCGWFGAGRYEVRPSDSMHCPRR